jgi:hypothetical protein
MSMTTTNGVSADAKRTRTKAVIVEKGRRRPVPGRLGASTQESVPQAVNNNLPRQGPFADTTAPVNLGSESAVADNVRDPSTNARSVNNAAVAEVKFPLCDAAVRKREGGEWELADAIVSECSETGDDGVRNGSHAKMEAMREEIAKNRGVMLSLERVRKLRKAASAFAPGRRRPAVSIEGHLEARTPEALDALIESAPNGTALTREYIRQLKHPTEEAEQDQQQAERGHQIKDQRLALQNLCRQAERDKEQLLREKEARERQYVELCRATGKEPAPVSPLLAPDDEPSPPTAEKLEQELQLWLAARRFDPTAGDIKRAISDFVKAVLAQQQ